MTDDQCRPVEVDGQTIRVHGGRPMTDHEQSLFAEIVRAAKRRWATDHADDNPNPVFPQTDPPGHPLYLSSLSLKTCGTCGADKRLDEFSSSQASRSRGGRCRECSAAASRARYDRQPDAEKTRRSAAYQSNRDKAIAVYGGRCVHCGSVDQLEFDHVNGDGGEHRAVESPTVMVERIARTGAPITDHVLQLLCQPCHRDKSADSRARR